MGDPTEIHLMIIQQVLMPITTVQSKMCMLTILSLYKTPGTFLWCFLLHVPSCMSNENIEGDFQSFLSKV